MYKTTFHRDGRITLWNVYKQSWQTYREPMLIPDEVMASLPSVERNRIIKMGERISILQERSI